MQGHQVMVFVHSRKETVKTAMALREAAVQDGTIESFSCEDHPQFHLFRQKIGESRNKEMKLLFDSGFGIHHAGMLRSDRNLMEKLFSEKVIKVSITRNKSPVLFSYELPGIMLYCNIGVGCQPSRTCR
jgi:antiviral helicase SLH1